MKYSDGDKENYFGLAILGVENQSNLDEFTPIRIMGYDYANYREQIDRHKSKLSELKCLMKLADNESYILARNRIIDMERKGASMKAKNQTKEIRQLRKAMREVIINVLELIGILAVLMVIVSKG